MSKFIAWLKKYHILHSWSKWKILSAGSSGEYPLPYTQPDLFIPRGVYTVQHRKCLVCSKAKLRREIS